MTRGAAGGAAWAVVPVKALNTAKRRLADALDLAARRELSLAMLADVLDALAGAPALDGIAVVTRDPAIAEFARTRYLRVIAETGVGLNPAVAEAARALAAEGCEALLVVPADLPLASPEEIMEILGAQRAAPALTLVPDRHGSGTNALACSPPDAIAPCFGANSFARHMKAAQDAGITATVLRPPGLRLDIDTPDDLRALLEKPGATWTHAVLRAGRSTAALAAGGEG